MAHALQTYMRLTRLERKKIFRDSDDSHVGDALPLAA